MMIDDEFQDLISELDLPDTFGQLTPADIAVIVPSFGGSEITEDEVGFVLEHEHLRQWGKVVAASYRDWLKSATPLLTKLTLSQSEAVILTSDYGNFFKVKFPYASSPLNLGAEETIELHVRSSDLIELLFTDGPLKSFRYSKTKKTLRAYASLFERPILLHTPNKQLYQFLPNTFYLCCAGPAAHPARSAVSSQSPWSRLHHRHSVSCGRSPPTTTLAEGQ